MKKRWIFPLTLVLLAALCACGSPKTVSAAPSPASEETAQTEKTELLSSFAAEDLEGNAVDETVLAGYKVTMVNVWQTTCGPCVREMPDLAELSRTYAERGVQVIGIVLDTVDRNGSTIPERKQEAKRIVSETGADYRHLLPPKSLLESWLGEIQIIPQTVFVDENGCRIGETYVGARSTSDWSAILEELLK